MMTLLLIVASMIAGLVLGLLYFGGLWLTVHRVVQGRWSRGMLLVSFFGRAVLVIAGLYGVIVGLGGRWEVVALGMVGFMAARFILVRTWGPQSAVNA